MAEGLKPCPFCGGHVQYVQSDPTYGITGIFCQGCKALTQWSIDLGIRENYGENADRWAEKWNRRANDDQG